MPRMSAPSTFVFDRNYNNKEQVRPFMGDYRRVRAELEAAGAYPYNASFMGRIPGIIGPNEETAIYLLQTLHEIDEMNEKVRAFLASGGREVDELDEVVRGTVVHYAFYSGGTGWVQYDQARLVPRGGRPHAVLPKGRRVNGHLLHGKVLFRP